LQSLNGCISALHTSDLAKTIDCERAKLLLKNFLSNPDSSGSPLKALVEPIYEILHIRAPTPLTPGTPLTSSSTKEVSESERSSSKKQLQKLPKKKSRRSKEIDEEALLPPTPAIIKPASIDAETKTLIRPITHQSYTKLGKKKTYVQGVSLEPGHKIKSSIGGVKNELWYIKFPQSHQGFYLGPITKHLNLRIGIITIVNEGDIDLVLTSWQIINDQISTAGGYYTLKPGQSESFQYCKTWIISATHQEISITHFNNQGEVYDSNFDGLGMASKYK